MHDRSQNRDSYPVYNENYEKDIQHVLQLCQLFLKPIGIWPLLNSNATKRDRIICVLLLTLCYLSLFSIFIPSGYFLIFEDLDISIRLKVFGPVTFMVTTMLKYLFLIINGPALRRCLDHVQRDWKILREEHHREIMMRNIAVGRNLITIFAGFLYTGGISYHTAVPYWTRQKIDENTTIRVHAYPGYDAFFDAHVSPNYEIVFCIQIIAAIVLYTILSAACSLTTVFVTHACGQIQIQMARLENLVNERKNMKVKFENPLSIIVHSHASTLRFSKDINEVLQETCMLEIASSTVLICIIEYYCVTEWKSNSFITVLTYAMVLFSVAFNVLILCYIGELLVEQCRQIGITSYEIEWYKLRDKEPLDLILLIAISHYPQKLTAGKICDLSLTTFGNVLKSSMVYLNLLRTFTEW